MHLDDVYRDGTNNEIRVYRSTDAAVVTQQPPRIIDSAYQRMLVDDHLSNTSLSASGCWVVSRLLVWTRRGTIESCDIESRTMAMRQSYEVEDSWRSVWTTSGNADKKETLLRTEKRPLYCTEVVDCDSLCYGEAMRRSCWNSCNLESTLLKQPADNLS